MLEHQPSPRGWAESSPTQFIFIFLFLFFLKRKIYIFKEIAISSRICFTPF
jgi:hypothetical protein